MSISPQNIQYLINGKDCGNTSNNEYTFFQRRMDTFSLYNRRKFMEISKEC